MSNAIDPEYQEVLAAWQRAPMIKGVDPDTARMDQFGRVIWFNEYNRKTEHGWHAILVDPAAYRSAKPQLEAVQWQPFPATKLKVV
jgi:hypothetical protein